MPACLRLLRNPISLFLTFLLLASGSYPGSTGARVLTPSPTAACVSAISFGETMACSVTSAGERDTYTFTAAANDELKVRMTRTAGTINPAIHIFSPANENICSAFTSDNIAEIGRCTIPVAGTYTLFAEDTYRTNTGSYNLYVQRLNNPGHAQIINFGQTLPDAIDLIAEIDTFAFRSAANKVVRIRMTRAANNLRPRIRVYDPDGINICSAFSSGDVAEISSCSLPRAGSYTILADETGSRTGGYTMYLECVDTGCSLATVWIYLPLVAIDH